MASHSCQHSAMHACCVQHLRLNIGADGPILPVFYGHSRKLGVVGAPLGERAPAEQAGLWLRLAFCDDGIQDRHCQQHQRRHAVRCMRMEAYGCHRCALETLRKGCVPVLQRPEEFVPSRGMGGNSAGSEVVFASRLPGMCGRRAYRCRLPEIAVNCLHQCEAGLLTQSWVQS